LKILRNGIVALVLCALGVALAAWWIVGPPLLEEPDPVVIADVSSERLTTLGSVVGFAVPGQGHAWLGIPFAAPPVGGLRWRPPQRAAPWTEPLDALAYGSPCIQLASSLGGVSDRPVGSLAGDEDCLRLNVWAPRFELISLPTHAERMPVMVWIHGGGNTVGHAGAFYDGSILAARHRVIVVSLNYRLGPFGFFAHPAVLAGGPAGEGASGNFATLDLIAGLRWVQENIEFFGGDPGNVTIFGESAGGTNVISLLLSPLAQGLFHRAIAQSGSTASVSVAEAVHYVDDALPGRKKSAREQVLRLLIGDGSASDRSSARLFADGLGAEELADFLRSRTPREIMSVYRDGETGSRISVPGLIRDGVVLPASPLLEALKAGRPGRSLPVMLGSNRDELKLFLFRDSDWVSHHMEVFFRIRDRDLYDVYSRLGSDLWKARGVDLPASALAAEPGRAVYAYRFDWDEEPTRLGTDYGALLGASHGMEIPFIFGHFKFDDPGLTRLLFNEENRSGRQYISDAMLSYWAEFAYAGTPGRGRDGSWPAWQPWRDEDAVPGEKRMGNFIVLDTPEDGGIRMSSQIITRNGILARLDAAKPFPGGSNCALFRDPFQFPEDWRESLRRKLLDRGCDGLPAMKFD
jgi:para-nitrobenzyl esterase